MSGTDSSGASACRPDRREVWFRRMHACWRAGVALAIVAGLLNLLNLIGPTRIDLGPLLITPFRVAFGFAWCALAARLVLERRLPETDFADRLVVSLVLIFLIRGIFDLATMSIVLNWLLTGAGVYFLVRLGMKDRSDVRLVLLSTLVAFVVIGIYGLLEYVAKDNPLFNAVQIDVIGADARIQASDQFYRIRSLIGHPGFLGAITLSSIPIGMLILWRRRLLMVLFLIIAVSVWFLTFSRGSWLLGTLILFPLILFRARGWFGRHWKLTAAIVLIPVAVIAVDYFDRQEASITFSGNRIMESGLRLNQGKDGQYAIERCKSEGLTPIDNFVYFSVGPEWRDIHRPVTVILVYRDVGNGSVQVDYDSRDQSAPGGADGSYKQTVAIGKNNTGDVTSTAFYLDDPRFDGRENLNSDFRVVDSDNKIILNQVILQKGKLNLPSMISYQWLSRSSSISDRLDLFPFAWGVLKANPFGVGIFQTPGTDHHAVDSLPLTWVMEFGWPGLALVLGLAFLLVYEGIKVWRGPRCLATVLFLALVIVLLHGGHLMILYDKPNLVLIAAVGAVYAAVRPWRRGGPAISATSDDCMI